MTDHFTLEPGKGIQSSTGIWYRCVQTLGAGGNAVAFLVLCTSGAHSGALFALKVFRRLSAPERREKFLQETRLLFKLSHPCILRVFDEGVFHTSAGEYPFVVAEYLPNTLQQLLQRDIPFIEKLAFSMQLLSALAHLGSSIWSVLNRMLTMNPETRPSAAELFGHWQANFFDAVLHQHALEGQAF